MSPENEQPTEEIDPSVTIIELIQMHYREYRTAQDGVERANHMDTIDELLDRLVAIGYTATGKVVMLPVREDPPELIA